MTQTIYIDYPNFQTTFDMNEIYSNVDNKISYIAPEFYFGWDITHKVDVFSLGVFFYRCLTGFAPYPLKPSAYEYKDSLSTLNEAPEEEYKKLFTK